MFAIRLVQRLGWVFKNKRRNKQTNKQKNRAGVIPGIRTSPSTYKVLTMDWQVRGLCRCLWYERGLCPCPCVITPRWFTSLLLEHRRQSIFFRVSFQQTNKQTKKPTKQTNCATVRGDRHRSKVGHLWVVCGSALGSSGCDCAPPCMTQSEEIDRFA